MSNRLIKDSHFAIIGMCAALALGGFNACTDSYALDEQGNNPEWLCKTLAVPAFMVLSTPTSS